MRLTDISGVRFYYHPAHKARAVLSRYFSADEIRRREFFLLALSMTWECLGGIFPPGEAREGHPLESNKNNLQMKLENFTAAAARLWHQPLLESLSPLLGTTKESVQQGS